MNITPPPGQFSGRFSEFYERHVEPNLPKPDRVAEFDSLLRNYLSNEDPVHVVRYVTGQIRGTIVQTSEGRRILPTDNSPVWWTHAFLHSGAALPGDANALFGNMPSHFFKMARIQTLNQAGYHAAHILLVKNRDTNWHGWSRAELARRMLANIHPCNVFLVAKREWQGNGGRPEILAWIKRAYLLRYGETMERFLADSYTDESSHIGPLEDPDYSYGWDRPAMTTRKSSPPFARPEQIATKMRAAHGLRTNRPTIWRDRVGRGISLEISMAGARYRLQHDDLVAWVGEHTTALETASWTKQGIYTWPRATTAMSRFLRDFEVQE